MTTEHATEGAPQDICHLGPYTLAVLIVTNKRIEVMRETGRISSPGTRLLRRVEDYLDAMSDVEMLDWPEVLNV